MSRHDAQIALMSFLSSLASSLGVGRHVYVVGGAVRNFVMDPTGKKYPIKDIDVVIDSVALRGKDSEWFARQIARAIPTATKIATNQYGVAILTVVGPWLLDGNDLTGEVIEIANARKESYGGAGKGYKPDQVVPATVGEDVERREFTFNTLMWRLQDLARGPDKAEIIDLTGCGLRDLQTGTMACPRDPDVVFADDPTRMLRAIKFVAKYGFKIPPDLADSIRRNASKMKNAPWEAIATLFVHNVLNEPTAPKSLRLMKSLGLLDVVAEMVEAHKPFATYLSRELRSHGVHLLLDLLDLGLSDPTPLRFLTPAQQARLRAITTGMPTAEADAFAATVEKPPVDNPSIIRDFDLKGADRSKPLQFAREVLLERPSLYGDVPGLDRAIRSRLGSPSAARVASRFLSTNRFASILDFTRVAPKKRRPRSSHGDCYEAAGSYIQDHMGDSGLRLVHGEVMGQGSLEGLTFGHAWVLDGGTVIDQSNGRDIRLPKEVYYTIGGIDMLANTHEYTPKEAIDQMLRHRHFGPWDLKTRSGL